MILMCAQDCPPHKKVEIMFRQYMSRNVESELQLPQFYHSMVKMPGITTYKAI